jgi:membrane-associated phospholipid phosphatase
LFAFEWVVLAYLGLTLLMIMFAYTKLQNPDSMIWGRMRVVAITASLWAVYRMVPCRLTLFIRVMAQVALLQQWYSETIEFNRMQPNLDHLFAGWEQSLFGFQPALLFSEKLSHPVFSELLTLGYVSYYPLMLIVPLYYLFYRYNEFPKASFVMLASFFLFYVIFIFLPVAGPQYYYPAAGIDSIREGIFPNIGTYFETHTGCLPIPGYQSGLMYKLLVFAHQSGERPTAAFPSSHVGIIVVLLWLVRATKNRRLFWSLVPFGVLMFFATFYIRAHYAIDALAGLAAGTLMYFLFTGLYHLCSGKNRV